MPHAPTTNAHYLASFRQKVTQTIIKAGRNHRHIDNFEAERIVWQELEELLPVPTERGLISRNFSLASSVE